MHRKLSIFCLFLAWLCAHGAIWNVVQVVGWAKMFHGYAQIMPATQALRLTFDGSAPCDFCEIAQTGQDAARDSKAPATLAGGVDKVLLIADCLPSPVLVAPKFSWSEVALNPGLTRIESVPVPPPRV